MRFVRSKLGAGILLALMCIVLTASPVMALPKLTSGTCPSIIKKGQTGNCVKELQTRLNKHGAKLTVDGDFGSLTFSAVEKFQTSAGLEVDGLVGPKTKAALYKSGNLRTTKPPKNTGGKSKVVSVARGEVGTKEGSKRANTYLSACGFGGKSTNSIPWCACFVSWVVKKTSATSYRNALVQNWVVQARAHTHGLSVTSNPKAGDLVAYDWENTGAHYDHIGIVRSVNGNKFTTIEGNTGSSGSQGVKIRDRSRTSNYKVLFIRLG